MYGSRSDDELDDAADAQGPDGQAPRRDESPRLDEGITQPIERVVDDIDDRDDWGDGDVEDGVEDGVEDDVEDGSSAMLTSLSPATAEQVAAYVAQIGTVMDDNMLLRPYVRTGGRTRADADLAIEALVMGVPSIEHTSIAPEHRQVHALCTEPRSVAEIAAYSRLPIGSARVIIADMLGLGLLIRCSSDVPAGSPSVELMARVRDGLRKL